MDWRKLHQNDNIFRVSALNRPISQIPQCICSISHNTPFRTEMCAHFCSESGIVGYGTGALWDLWIRPMTASHPGGQAAHSAQGTRLKQLTGLGWRLPAATPALRGECLGGVGQLRSHEKRWCLMSMSRTPSLRAALCCGAFVDRGSSQSADRLKANWAITLQRGMTTYIQHDNYAMWGITGNLRHAGVRQLPDTLRRAI